MNTSIVLCVKNEEKELPYWLAWHKMLGFDTFIIYNDSSEDNTESVILSLSSFYDIIYHKNSKNNDRSVLRQIRCYNHAVENYGKLFDWMAFLDADEYLDLNGDYIKEYLNKFSSDISLVAFNWCCVGTNGFVSRPVGAPFLNYTKHSSPDEYWNKHTKIILKPCKVKEFYQVHNAIVDGISVNSEGDHISWESHHGGFTSNSPSWNNGKLIHFQSRSLEHYVRRDKNLEDVRKNQNDPLHEVTRNTNYSRIDLILSEEYLRKYKSLLLSASTSQIYYIKNKFNNCHNKIFRSICNFVKPDPVRVFHQSHKIQEGEQDKYLDYTVSELNFLSSIIKNSDLSIVEIKSIHVDNHNPIKCLFIRNNEFVHFVNVDIKHDPRVTPLKTYQIKKNIQNTISFYNPQNDRFLCMEPNGELTTDRRRAFVWERFYISKVDCNENLHKYENILKAVHNPSIQNIAKSGEFIPNVVSSLPHHYVQAIKFLCKGVLQEHLI